ncbi:MAG: energy transducer TonB [Acidobacteriia bacterium]|nr:energy transducer TonB [Terriglobia bacterium]
MQRVSRELALHIGPIADIVVRRAASHCASVDDLYLKVAEEIDSRDEREKFLLHQARSPATALPAASDTTTLAHSVSGKFGEPAPSEASNVGLKAPRSAPWIQRSSRRKYLLPVVGGSVFLVLLLALAIRFARPRGAGSSQIVQTTPQKTQVAESVPINSSTLSSPAEPRSKTTEPVKSPAKGALGKSGPSTPQRVRVSQGVSTGLLIKKVTPNYPPLARQARVQGLIVLQAEISKEGTIQNLQLISGHPMLAPAAIEAVKQWRYKPYVINGKPVAVETQVTVDFALKNQ